MKRKNKMKKGERMRSREERRYERRGRQTDGRREEEKKEGKGKQNVRISLVQTTQEEGLSVFHFLMMLKPLTVCITTNGKILKEIGIPDHLTSLLRNLYAGQEATVRTGHETIDWFQIRKGVHQGCILSPCLFNLYVEYLMQIATQAGIKIAGRNSNNLRYADNTTLMEESK